MNEPIKIFEKPKIEDIIQYFTLVEKDEHKFKVLNILCDKMRTQKIIVFCNTKRRVLEIEELIKKQEII